MISHELRLFPRWHDWDNWLGSDKIPFPIIWLGDARNLVMTVRYMCTPEKSIEQHIAEALSHEVLHIVIDEVESDQASKALDEICALHWELYSQLEGSA